MLNISKDLVFVILQFLKEEKYMEAMHKLEKESGLFFNLRYFEECIMNGEWEEADDYLSGFTKVDDNRFSTMLFFAIRKHNYLEALDSHDNAKAVQILRKDLKVFSNFGEALFRELTDLLTLSNIRENEQLATYSDAKTARANLVGDLKKLIEPNPLLCGKLEFPSFNNSRLGSLVKQSVLWQHHLCQKPKRNVNVKTLFVDHSCDKPNSALTPSPVATALSNYRPAVGSFQQIGARARGLAPAPVNTTLGRWITELNQMPQQAISGGEIVLALPQSSCNKMTTSMLNHPRHPTSNNPGLGIVDSEHVVKRPTPIRIWEMNGNGHNLLDVISGIPADPDESWKFEEIDKPSQLRSLKLPDSSVSMKIMKLTYTYYGGGVLALTFNAAHKHWNWQRNDQNPTGKAITTDPPQPIQPQSGILMMNDISGASLKEAVPCFALSNNQYYVISASGGKISVFNVVTFEVMTSFTTQSAAPTSLAFIPQDNNVVAIGMEDSSIQIYNMKLQKVISKLKGHQSRVTSLAFSELLNVLVSSGSDAQVCVWNTQGWEKKGSKYLSIPSGREPNPLAQTRVQFHKDQTHMLVIHETLLAIYDASKLERINQWAVPLESCGVLTDATYSCDSQLVYASFQDGSICVLTALPLRLSCRIYSTSYLPSSIRFSRVHGFAIAAHPEKPNQFAVGLTNGGVLVMEPLETEGKWGTDPIYEIGECSSTGPG